MPLITIVSALCVADYIETWPREFSSIWKRKTTGTSVLFLVNRYTLLLSVMIQAISAFPGNGTDEQCQALNTIYSIFTVLSIVAANVLFALRVYAIYSRNNVIFGMASAFIISRFALDIWVSVIITELSRISCLYFIVLEVGASTIDSPFQNLLRLKLGIPLLALGYDTFIFVLTAMKTVQHSLEMQRLKHSSITQIIIRDGKLPNLLISRLMLNLRTYPEPGNTTISQGQQTHVSSLNFASNQMLGNIGAPFDGGSFNEEEEEEEEEERVEIEAIGGQHDRSGEPER
ncbi:uncharacterized protein C8R40DRAFT_1056548 [Lentinula edodes]|uniref:uncharacterized protein n=1 Tax=Lentinula edodes TaxID=5353 RepID=UPI001E8D25F7|nr:uncharacterized protein C8R40DRAFT_1056548 [Lentinula edodes]KAH7870606.1 hypothetical protein C8R40DRAFT_1056548 [Lentinula edodes]